MTTATMLPNGRGAGTSQDRQKAETDKAVKGALQPVPTPSELVDTKKAAEGAEIILQQVRAAGSQIRNIFNFLRSCGMGKGEDAWNYADGTARVAEGMAITRFNKALAENEPGTKPAKTLGDVARIQGMKTLTWVQGRQRIMNAHQSREEHALAMSNYYNFIHKNEGADLTVVADDFLDMFSKRYEDVAGRDGKVLEHGATKFMRDIAKAEDYRKLYDAKNKAFNAASSKKAAAETGKNGEDATGGMKNGDRYDRKALGDKVGGAVDLLLSTVHEIYSERNEQWLLEALSDFIGTIKDKAAEVREQEKEAVSRAGNTRSAGVKEAAPQGQEQADDLPELDDEDEQNIDEVQAG